jgi:hypothetical protein
MWQEEGNVAKYWKNWCFQMAHTKLVNSIVVAGQDAAGGTALWM